MFGSGKLKQQNQQLQQQLEQAQARSAELETQLAQAQQQAEQAQYQADSDRSRQQGRFRELWFAGAEAVVNVRESMARSAGTLYDERHTLDDAKDAFANSSSTLQSMETSLQAISADAERNCEHIGELQGTAQEIGKFVGVISEISEQTNLLALNAAIEAARAGEQGRGFAVVADEVRALAKKANAASSEITRLVNSITQRTAVADGDIRGMAEQSKELVASTNEVSSAVNQVVGLSQQMHQIVSRTAAETFIETVKLDHVVWKTDVYKRLLGLSQKSTSEFADHTQCRLGKWYFEGDGRQFYSDSSYFRQLDAPHQGVHDSGLKALALMEQDQCDEALDALAEMENSSVRVLDALSNLSSELS
ncbi:MAG: methyl-accepting chemotaxis protein [Halopseudomonas sp.]